MAAVGYAHPPSKSTVTAAHSDVAIQRITAQLAADPALFVELEANSRYLFDARVLYSGMIRYAFSGPEDGEITWDPAGVAEESIAVVADGGVGVLHTSGTIHTTSAGTLTLLWGAGTAQSPGSRLADSYLTAMKVG